MTFVSAARRTLCLAAGCLAAGCTTVPQRPPPVEVAWMSRTFDQLKEQLLYFACLSDKVYDFGTEPPRASNGGCEKRLGAAEIKDHHPRVAGRPGETADYIIVKDPARREQYLAIRGTDPKRIDDIIVDASLRKPLADDPLHVPMHSGFRAYADAVLDSLRTLPPEQRLDPDFATYITGHSLGGAAALIVALELHFAEPQRVKVAGVFTYGQPRVFDNYGATAWPEFSRRIYRVVSCRDPVPMVPRGKSLLDTLFSLRLFGPSAADYQHMGQEILLMDGGAYWLSGDLEVWRDFDANLDSLIRDALAGKALDHGIATYEKRLQEAMGAGARGPLNPGYEDRCTAGSPRLSRELYRPSAFAAYRG